MPSRSAVRPRRKASSAFIYAPNCSAVIRGCARAFGVAVAVGHMRYFLVDSFHPAERISPRQWYLRVYFHPQGGNNNKGKSVAAPVLMRACFMRPAPTLPMLRIEPTLPMLSQPALPCRDRAIADAQDELPRLRMLTMLNRLPRTANWHGRPAGLCAQRHGVAPLFLGHHTYTTVVLCQAAFSSAISRSALPPRRRSPACPAMTSRSARRGRW